MEQQVSCIPSSSLAVGSAKILSNKKVEDMEFYANEGKAVQIHVGDRTFARHAIKTKFVEIGDDYLELVRQFVLPVYQPGDILSMSEKIIALCQGRVIYEEDVKPGALAKFLSKFVHQTSAGPGAGNVFKMQFAIQLNGPVKVIWAAICAGVGKIFGKKGVFYDIVTETVFANAGSGTPGYDTAANVTETIPFTTAYSAAFPMAQRFIAATAAGSFVNAFPCKPLNQCLHSGSPFSW